MERVAIDLLGNFTARQSGTAIELLNRQPALQLVLAYLALHPQTSLPRQQVAFTLWPDSSESQARANLRQSLYALRTLLPDDFPLQAGQQTLMLLPHPQLAVDLWEFKAALAQPGSDPASLARAVELYRGDLLEGRYDDWIIPFREHYRLQYQQALSRLADHYSQRGELERAVLLTRQLLALDPFQEGVARALMQRLTLLGDRAAALACYDQLQRLLAAELGATPMPETLALAEQIARGELQPPPALQTVSFMPHRASTDRSAPLVGRTAELRWLAAAPAPMRLLAGESGIGKTRLLTEFCERHTTAPLLYGECSEATQSIPYGVLIDPLRQALALLGQRLSSLLESHWLQELARLLPELGPAPERAPLHDPGGGGELHLLEAMLRLLAAVQPAAMLVLDDLQWADEATLRWLRFAAPRLEEYGIVLLGAYQLGVESPALQELCDLLRGRRLLALCSLRPLSESDLVELLQQAGQLQLPPQQAPFTSRLYAETQGNPFYLMELLRALFAASVLAEQDGVWRLVDQHAAAGLPLPLPESVQASVRARLAGLDETSCELLAGAAVLGRPATLQELVALTRVQAEPLWPLLRRLEQRRIMVQLQSGSFAFGHSMLRQVVYQDLGPARQRYLHHLVGERLAELQANPAEIAWHFEQAGEQERLLSYLVLAADQAAAIPAYSLAQQDYQRALQLWEQLVPPDTRRLERAALERRLGQVLVWQGQYEAAERMLRRALGRLGQELPARAGRQLPSLTRQTLRHLRSSLREYLGLGRRPTATPELTELVVLYEALTFSLFHRDLWGALQTHLRELNTAHQLGRTAAAGFAYVKHGMAADTFGWFRYGWYFLKRGLSVLEVHGSSWQTAFAHAVLFMHDYYRGDLAALPERAAEAMRRARETNDPWLIGYVHLLQGYAAEVSGDYAAARQTYQAMADLCRETHNLQLLGMAQERLGAVALKQGQLRQALAVLQQGLANSQTCYDVLNLVCLYGWIAQAQLAQGELAAALDSVQAGLATWRQRPGAVPHMVELLVTAVEVRLQVWQREQAAAAWREVQQALRQAQRFAARFPAARPQVERVAALVYAAAGKQRAARRTLERSLASARALGLAYEEARALLLHSQLFADAEAQTSARLLFERLGLPCPDLALQSP